MYQLPVNVCMVLSHYYSRINNSTCMATERISYTTFSSMCIWHLHVSRSACEGSVYTTIISTKLSHAGVPMSKLAYFVQQL